jgi:hypothetical protein
MSGAKRPVCESAALQQFGIGCFVQNAHVIRITRSGGMSDDEGFSNGFEKAWRESTTMIGHMLGGCLPWLFLAVIVLFILLVFVKIIF